MEDNLQVIVKSHTYLLETMKSSEPECCANTPLLVQVLCCKHYISIYLDEFLANIVGQIYPTELQLNKANSSDTEAPFSDLNLSITNGIVSSKIYDKRDAFNFEIVNFPFLDGDVPRYPSYGVYISQLIHFARVCSNVYDFSNRNLFLTAKLLKQGYRYHKI